MAKQQTAIVFVEREWYDRSMRHLVSPSPSGSTSDVHLLIGPLDDADNRSGLRLRDFRTTLLKADGSEVTTAFMIPWRFVIALFVVDETNLVPVGVNRNDVTVLK